MTIEMEKRNPNMTFLSGVMDRTFSLRRKEIVEQEPHVELVKNRWPALFLEYQVGVLLILTLTLSAFFFQNLFSNLFLS